VGVFVYGEAVPSTATSCSLLGLLTSPFGTSATRGTAPRHSRSASRRRCNGSHPRTRRRACKPLHPLARPTPPRWTRSASMAADGIQGLDFFCANVW